MGTITSDRGGSGVGWFYHRAGDPDRPGRPIRRADQATARVTAAAGEHDSGRRTTRRSTTMWCAYGSDPLKSASGAIASTTLVANRDAKRFQATWTARAVPRARPRATIRRRRRSPQRRPEPHAPGAAGGRTAAAGPGSIGVPVAEHRPSSASASATAAVGWPWSRAAMPAQRAGMLQVRGRPRRASRRSPPGARRRCPRGRRSAAARGRPRRRRRAASPAPLRPARQRPPRGRPGHPGALPGPGRAPRRSHRGPIGHR